MRSPAPSAAPKGSWRVPDRASPCLGHRCGGGRLMFSSAFLCPPVYPCSPSSLVLVMSPCRVSLNVIPCYMCRPLMPTLSHLHVSQFSVCFLLPCEAPEDYLTEPVDLSLCFLTFLCIGMTYVCAVAILPVDNADAPRSLCFRTGFPEG